MRETIWSASTTGTPTDGDLTHARWWSQHSPLRASRPDRWSWPLRFDGNGWVRRRAIEPVRRAFSRPVPIHAAFLSTVNKTNVYHLRSRRNHVLLFDLDVDSMLRTYPAQAVPVSVSTRHCAAFCSGTDKPPSTLPLHKANRRPAWTVVRYVVAARLLTLLRPAAGSAGRQFLGG